MNGNVQVLEIRMEHLWGWVPESIVPIHVGRLGPRTQAESHKDQPRRSLASHRVEIKWELRQSLLKTESAEMDRASGRLGKERRVSLIFARALGFLLRIVIG